MKTKTDFVTNSSSTSFIFNDKSLTIKDVAIEMIDLIVREYKRDFPREGKFSWAISAKKKLKKLDDNTNLILPWSCNYPSYLYRDSEGNVRVDTSWNHHWEDLESSTGGAEEFGKEFKISQKQNFFNLQTGKTSTRIQTRIDEWMEFNKNYGSNKSDGYVAKMIEELKKEAEEGEDEN